MTRIVLLSSNGQSINAVGKQLGISNKTLEARPSGPARAVLRENW